MNAKHSAGPWQIRYGGLTDSDEGYGIMSKLDVHDGIIAEAWPCRTTPELRRTLRANARLIAAAPDLLQACRAVLESLLKTDLGGAIPWVNPPYQAAAVHETAFERLAAVIEKATGEDASTLLGCKKP